MACNKSFEWWSSIIEKSFCSVYESFRLTCGYCDVYVNIGQRKSNHSSCLINERDKNFFFAKTENFILCRRRATIWILFYFISLFFCSSGMHRMTRVICYVLQKNIIHSQGCCHLCCFTFKVAEQHSLFSSSNFKYYIAENIFNF